MQSQLVPLPLRLLIRGAFLRCPRCGRGKLYRKWYTMFDKCGYCGWRFEREEGYWTGAMAINLVGTELLLAAVAIPLAVAQAPVIPVSVAGVILAICLPVGFYRHAKSLWMTVDFLLHPVDVW